MFLWFTYILGAFIFFPAAVQPIFFNVTRNMTCYHYSYERCINEYHPYVTDPECRKVNLETEVGIIRVNKCSQCGIRETWRNFSLFKIERWCLVSNYSKGKCTVEYPELDEMDTAYEICRCDTHNYCNSVSIFDLGGLGNRTKFPPRRTLGDGKDMATTLCLTISRLLMVIAFIMLYSCNL